MKEFTLQVLITSILGGALGGFITYFFSNKLNKKNFQRQLRYEKYDNFVGTVNRMRDYIDIAIQEVKVQYINLKDLNQWYTIEDTYLFNEILKLNSQFLTLVNDYGLLFNIKNYDYYEVVSIHKNILDLYFKSRHIRYYSKNKSQDIEEAEQIIDELEAEWSMIRPELLNIYNAAHNKMKKDLN